MWSFLFGVAPVAGIVMSLMVALQVLTEFFEALGEILKALAVMLYMVVALLILVSMLAIGMLCNKIKNGRIPHGNQCKCCTGNRDCKETEFDVFQGCAILLAAAWHIMLCHESYTTLLSGQLNMEGLCVRCVMWCLSVLSGRRLKAYLIRMFMKRKRANSGGKMNLHSPHEDNIENLTTTVPKHHGWKRRITVAATELYYWFMHQVLFCGIPAIYIGSVWFVLERYGEDMTRYTDSAWYAVPLLSGFALKTDTKEGYPASWYEAFVLEVLLISSTCYILVLYPGKAKAALFGPKFDTWKWLVRFGTVGISVLAGKRFRAFLLKLRMKPGRIDGAVHAKQEYYDRHRHSIMMATQYASVRANWYNPFLLFLQISYLCLLSSAPSNLWGENILLLCWFAVPCLYGFKLEYGSNQDESGFGRFKQDRKEAVVLNDVPPEQSLASLVVLMPPVEEDETLERPPPINPMYKREQSKEADFRLMCEPPNNSFSMDATRSKCSTYATRMWTRSKLGRITLLARLVLGCLVASIFMFVVSFPADYKTFDEVVRSTGCESKIDQGFSSREHERFVETARRRLLRETKTMLLKESELEQTLVNEVLSENALASSNPSIPMKKTHDHKEAIKPEDASYADWMLELLIYYPARSASWCAASMLEEVLGEDYGNVLMGIQSYYPLFGGEGDDVTSSLLGIHPLNMMELDSPVPPHSSSYLRFLWDSAAGLSNIAPH